MSNQKLIALKFGSSRKKKTKYQHPERHISSQFLYSGLYVKETVENFENEVLLP